MKRMAPHILHSQKGIALFLVLWVLTLLMVIVGEFCYTMRTEIRITRNFMEQIQARTIAEAGIYTTIAGLLKKNNETKTRPATSAEEDTYNNAFRLNIEPPVIPFDVGAFRAHIDNEAGKININQVEPQLLRFIFNGMGIDTQEQNIIIDSIIDWRDTDNLHRLNGAENDYYNNLPDPYPCKNGPFSSAEELLLVRGITQEIFDTKLKELVTALPPDDKMKSKPKTSSSKSKAFDYQKININAASREMLNSLPRMNEELVNDVLTFREIKDFTSLGEFQEVVGPEIFQLFTPYITLKLTPYYTITVTGEIKDSKTKKTIRAVVMLDEKSEKQYRLLQWLEG